MLANMGSGSGARHLLRAGRMLANWGLDWCQAPDAVGADASKLGTGSGARHPLRGGRMLANWGLDLVPGTCCGAVGC